jgi:hypothetical protein
MLSAGLGELVDRRPGGSPVHGLLPAEEAEILAVFEQWAEIDRSHRKLAHRGSYLHRFWASPSTVRRVLVLHDRHFPPAASAGAIASSAVPGMGRVPTELHLDLRHGAPRGAS